MKEKFLDDDQIGCRGQVSKAQAVQRLHITLGVLTFRRPEGIAKLLDVMCRQVHRPERPYRLSIVVVDNDPAASGRDAVMAYADSDTYSLHYVVEPTPGIPASRNRAMDCAPEGTELFCFLDDDEWPVDDWLDSMIRTWRESDAQCVYGQVEPVFEGPVTDWIRKSRLFDRRKFEDGAKLDFAASNNVMFELPLFRAMGLRFDMRMQFTGGSDYLFFDQAVRRGVVVRWCEKALVYDIIPASRTSIAWLRQRQYRIGHTLALGAMLNGSAVAKVKCFLRGVMRIGIGAALSPASLVSPYWGGRSMFHLLRGIGTVVGMLGHKYEEYCPDKLAESAASKG